jgi:hypothetical protein
MLNPFNIISNDLFFKPYKDLKKKILFDQTKHFFFFLLFNI